MKEEILFKAIADVEVGRYVGRDGSKVIALKNRKRAYGVDEEGNDIFNPDYEVECRKVKVNGYIEFWPLRPN